MYDSTKLNHYNFHHENCYGCGFANTFGLNAKIQFNTQEQTAHVFNYKPKLYHEGGPTYVHGGVLSALFDEVQGILCCYLGYKVLTKKLEVEYLKVSSLQKIIHIRSHSTKKEKRLLYTKATAYNDNNQTIAESSGIWYIVPDRMLQRIWPNEGLEQFSKKWDAYHKKLS